MDWLDNNVWMFAITGIVVAVIGFIAYSQLNKKPVLYTGVAGTVVAIAALIFGRAHMTDEEMVEATLQEIARLIQNEEFDQALAYFDESATAKRGEASGRLNGLEVHSCRITRFKEIQLDYSGPNPKASVKFVVRGDIASDFGYDGVVVQEIDMDMVRKDGVWLILDYSRKNPLSGK